MSDRVTTQAALARRLGVSDRTIRNWQNQGMPRNDDGSYCLSSVEEWRDAQVHGNTDEDDIEVLSGRAKNRRELERWSIEWRKARAIAETLRVQQMRGTLIDRAEVEAEWAKRAAVVRMDLQMAADALPASLEGQSAARIREILRSRFEVICNRYSSDGDGSS